MKYLLGSIILVAFVLNSCKQNGSVLPKKPDNLLSEEKMVDVLYEMAILSAAKSTNRKLLESNRVDPVKYVYTKHNIDSLQFAQSNDYYSLDLELYESIYNRVKTRLQADKAKFEELAEADKLRKDSLSQLRKRIRDTTNLKRSREELLKSNPSEGELIKTKTPVPLKNIDTTNQSTRQ